MPCCGRGYSPNGYTPTNGVFGPQQAVCKPDGQLPAFGEGWFDPSVSIAATLLPDGVQRGLKDGVVTLIVKAPNQETLVLSGCDHAIPTLSRASLVVAVPQLFSPMRVGA